MPCRAVNELGYIPFPKSGGALLFHLISKLYEQTSVIPLVLCSSRLLCDDGATARHVIYDGQWRGSDRSPLGRCGPS
ncbi:MAG: hypothetical protein ACI9HB_002796, partial [Gammaproteobacteria bacterium]